MKNIDELIEENIIFQKKFTVGYKNLLKEEKDTLDFSKSMCNIWGFMEELILEIKDLKARILALEGS